MGPRTESLESQRRFRNFLIAILCRLSQTDFIQTWSSVNASRLGGLLIWDPTARVPPGFDARRAPLTVSGTAQAYRPGKRCRRKRYLLLYSIPGFLASDLETAARFPQTLNRDFRTGANIQKRVASAQRQRSLFVLMRRFLSLTLLGCLLAFAVVPLAPAQNLPNTTRLLRFPTTNGRQIVFCYAGELYTVAKEGGIARRITSGPGYTSFPRFSPDGTQLAFTSQYDGNTEVYVMPAEGGAPKRLTTSATLGRDDISDRMGPNNLVMAWENTKPLVVFRSRMKSFNDFIGQLFTVGLDAELPQQLPVPRGGFVSFSPDDSKMAFNRVFREFRTWKHYRGGMADDIWIYDFKNGTTENLTNNPAQDICPMWGPDNRIYFIFRSRWKDEPFLTDLTSKEQSS